MANKPTASTTGTKAPDLIGLYKTKVKELATARPDTWSKRDSGELAVTLLQSRLDRDGNPIEFNEDQKKAVHLAFDAKLVQHREIERILDEAGADLDSEAAGLLDRIYDPASFQQDLIADDLKTVTRKTRIRFKD